MATDIIIYFKFWWSYRIHSGVVSIRPHYSDGRTA